MTGGITSAVHRLAVDRDSRRYILVLRQYERAETNSEQARQEAETLLAIRNVGLPAPELVAFDAEGSNTGTHPAVLMSRLPGRLDLTPRDPDDWLGQIARVAVRIHACQIAAPGFRSWIDTADLPVPASAGRPPVWRVAFTVLRQPQPPLACCFIHRDFQHFNFLWRRGRLTGVVDWAMASTGPADIDVGHCRLNLAVLFGADLAERFRSAYEAESGRAVDPWWDLHALASYGDSWLRFIPVQVAGRAPVDVAGMTRRVEDLLEMTLARL